MARPLLPVAALALLLAACGGPEPAPADAPAATGGEAGADHVDEDAAAAARRAREAAARELPRLLPLDDSVRWYEVRRAGSERVRQVALLTARRGRLFLEAVGLTAPGTSPLRFWRGGDEVWLLPAGALGPEVGHAPYRAWSADPTWDDGPEGRGRRTAVDVVATPSGEARGVRVDHARSGDVLVRHVFAHGVGLVTLEVHVRGEVALRLDLVEVCPRGSPPVPYDASTPPALWRSVGEALRRADVDGLDRLMSPALRRRKRTSAWERVADLAPGGPPSEAPQADRVAAALGELLDLDVRPRGAWVVDGDEATAPALVTVPDEPSGMTRTMRGQLVLRRHADGAWRWEDVRLP